MRVTCTPQPGLQLAAGPPCLPVHTTRTQRRGRRSVIAATHSDRESSAVSRRSVLALTAGGAALSLSGGASAADSTVHDFTVMQYGKPVSMSKFKGKVCIIVNIANYPGLRYLLETYGKEGFEVIAFPCNQFGGQAPLGSEGERSYGYKKFGIDTFPIMDEIEVNGPNADPLYKYMKDVVPRSVPGSRFALDNSVLWNYEKFLIDRDGRPVQRYKSPFNPQDAEADVRLVLAGKDLLPEECIMHPGRSKCKVEKYL